MAQKEQTRTAAKPQEEGGILSTANRLEELAGRYAVSALECKGRFEMALTLAEGISVLRQALGGIIDRMMPLQNTQLGFLTDKKEQGYPPAVVVECLAEAMLRGLRPALNEFNIIAGKMYVTKEGYARLVRELPGLTDLRLEPGIPKMLAGGAVVPFRATWKIDGKGFILAREIPVRLNAGMGVDGALGKATRKMLASIHGRCTGSFLTEGDAEGDDVPALPEKKPVRENGHPAFTTQEQRGQLSELAARLKLTEEAFRELCEQFGAPGGDGNQLTQKQAEELLMHLEDLAAAQPAEA